ncbi:MAG: hypothetical protein ABEJ36_00150 [Candidatus Nanosalina sp.]
MELSTSLEQISPAECLHEVNYGGVLYMLDSEDLNYFFEFRDDIDEFDEDIYRIESNFGDVHLEASRLPGDDESYRAMIFSRDSEEYPLDAYRSLFSEQLVKGMKTRLAL